MCVCLYLARMISFILCIYCLLPSSFLLLISAMFSLLFCYMCLPLKLFDFWLCSCSYMLHLLVFKFALSLSSELVYVLSFSNMFFMIFLPLLFKHAIMSVLLRLWKTNGLLSHLHVWFNIWNPRIWGFLLTILIFVFESGFHNGTLDSQTHYESAGWTCISLLMILNFSSIKILF